MCPLPITSAPLPPCSLEVDGLDFELLYEPHTCIEGFPSWCVLTRQAREGAASRKMPSPTRRLETPQLCSPGTAQPHPYPLLTFCAFSSIFSSGAGAEAAVPSARLSVVEGTDSPFSRISSSFSSLEGGSGL